MSIESSCNTNKLNIFYTEVNCASVFYSGMFPFQLYPMNVFAFTYVNW